MIFISNLYAMKNTSSLLFVFSTVCLTVVIGCKNSDKEQEPCISYPGPKPDSMALVFAKGIFSTDSSEFNSNFSQDGKLFFLSRRTPQGKTDIYISNFDGKNWGNPELASFSEPEFSEADPFITPDGTLYYISDRKKNKSDTIPDYDIWYVHPLANGKWSEPENLEAVNSDSTEYYVSLSDNKNVYFGSNRPGGFGLHDIYVSKFIDGKYSVPENLGPAVNAAELDHDPFISKDEKLLIFTSKNRKDGYGKGDLYYSIKGEDGKWSQAQNMGKHINTASYDFCPYVTPDSKYFFFSSDNDIKWIDINYLPKN